MSSLTDIQPAERIGLAVILTSVAYTLFSAQDAAIKILVVSISVWQVMVFRSVVILAGCAAVAGPTIFRDAIRSSIFKPMLLRSVLILSAWLCYYTAARSMQLAEMTTIYFAAPVIVTILSIFILREHVPALRWLAVLMGFAGVFIACDPASLGFSLPVILVLAAAFLWALSIVMMRKVALKERTLVQLVLNNVFYLLAALAPMAYYWHTPSGEELTLLITVGVFGGAAQYLLFEGMKRAPASVIAPFEYTSLIWSFIYGYLIWSDVPRHSVFIGAGLIVSAGLVIIGGEHFRKRQIVTPPS